MSALNQMSELAAKRLLIDASRNSLVVELLYNLLFNNIFIFYKDMFGSATFETNYKNVFTFSCQFF